MPQKLLWSVERVFLGRAVEMRVRGSFVIILFSFFLFIALVLRFTDRHS